MEIHGLELCYIELVGKFKKLVFMFPWIEGNLRHVQTPKNNLTKERGLKKAYLPRKTIFQSFDEPRNRFRQLMKPSKILSLCWNCRTIYGC